MKKSENSVGANIRDVRMKMGISQSKLAEKCGFSNTIISNYETGEKNPSLCSLAKIAKQLNVSIDRLYFGDENEAFIKAEPDIGRKVVNAVYLLWAQGVISLYDYMNFGTNHNNGGAPNRMVLYVYNYAEQIQRLITVLDDFSAKKSTFNDPDQYLEQVLSSVANEINRLY